MTPNGIHWGAPPLSTASLDAAICYCDGIAALVAGTPIAEHLLTLAVEHDPTFLLAQAGLAVIRYQRGAPTETPPITSRVVVSRPERQHTEIVWTALHGDHGRASDLRREHLLEFPGDVLIVWLPTVFPAP